MSTCPKGKQECWVEGCGKVKLLRQHEGFTLAPDALLTRKTVVLFDRQEADAVSITEKVKAFVTPYYFEKDIMHDMSHIDRLLRLSRDLSKGYDVDQEILTLSAYLHGIIYICEPVIREFLLRYLPEERVEQVLEAVSDSSKESEPETIEGKILHDAHLLEGGKTFIITKSLVTGTLRRQTLKETIDYIENNILGRFKCCLPECQELYKQKEEFARKFLDDLKRQL